MMIFQAPQDVVFTALIPPLDSSVRL